MVVASKNMRNDRVEYMLFKNFIVSSWLPLCRLCTILINLHIIVSFDCRIEESNYYILPIFLQVNIFFLNIGVSSCRFNDKLNVFQGIN